VKNPGNLLFLFFWLPRAFAKKRIRNSIRAMDDFNLHSLFDEKIEKQLLEFLQLFSHNKLKKSRYRPGVAQRFPGS
jgi:hypothetical protein